MWTDARTQEKHLKISDLAIRSCLWPEIPLLSMYITEIRPHGQIKTECSRWKYLQQPQLWIIRCPYRQQNTLNTVEQWEDATHNYMYQIDESQNNIDQKKPNSRENILYDSIVQRWAKLMVLLKAVWPYFWAAGTRRSKSGFWKLVMSCFSTWMLVTEGRCSVSRLVPSSPVFSWHGNHGFMKADW